jgi:alpha-N-acetylglucosamine transferase
MRVFKVSYLLAAVGLILLLFFTLPSLMSNSHGSSAMLASTTFKSYQSLLTKYVPQYSFGAARRREVPPFDFASVPRRRRYAITSSVQTASFAGLALSLGYTIQKYNDLEALDAELILLVRTDGADSVTAENITRLEKVGWTVKIAEELEFDHVNTGEIRAWHRHNLNKLHIWTWTQYEKILFIDADILCKGSLAEIFSMPGDIAAASDSWWDNLVDSRFNSGVIVIRPNLDEFRSLFAAVSDPQMHKPDEADQALLNNYYQMRHFGLPFKYNLNLVMQHYHNKQWEELWDEAVFVHFTMKKPNPTLHCERDCDQWEQLEWFSMVYQEMLAYYNFTNLPVLG